MPVTLIEAASVEPLNIIEMRDFLRLEHDADDELIGGLIVAAREYCENYTRRAFISQKWRLSLDMLPHSGRIGLPKSPLVSVDAVRFIDDDGVETILDPSLYFVDVASEPGRMEFVGTLPSFAFRKIGGVEVDFTAGFGASAADVPQPILQAMRLIIAHWYENREAASFAGSARITPLSAAGILSPYRMVTL